MTHPQIPPNCPYFREDHYDGRIFFEVWDPESEDFLVCPVFLDKIDSGWRNPLRPIIADIAEVAWRRINERLLPDGSNGETIRAALRHALAWRDWGEKANQEKGEDDEETGTDQSPEG